MTLYFGSQEFVCESAEEAQMYLDKIVGFVQSQMGFRAFDDNGHELMVDMVLKAGGIS